MNFNNNNSIIIYSYELFCCLVCKTHGSVDVFEVFSFLLHFDLFRKKCVYLVHSCMIERAYNRQFEQLSPLLIFRLVYSRAFCLNWRLFLFVILFVIVAVVQFNNRSLLDFSFTYVFKAYLIVCYALCHHHHVKRFFAVFVSCFCFSFFRSKFPSVFFTAIIL